jgi:hypothetical protein
MLSLDSESPLGCDSAKPVSMRLCVRVVVMSSCIVDTGHLAANPDPPAEQELALDSTHSPHMSVYSAQPGTSAQIGDISELQGCIKHVPNACSEVASCCTST